MCYNCYRGDRTMKRYYEIQKLVERLDSKEDFDLLEELLNRHKESRRIAIEYIKEHDPRNRNTVIYYDEYLDWCLDNKYEALNKGVFADCVCQTALVIKTLMYDKKEKRTMYGYKGGYYETTRNMRIY